MRLTSVLLLATLLASSAHAHTTVRSPMTEGVREDNALRIGHGCDEAGVIAQSVVFPGADPVLSAAPPATPPADLADVIAQGGIAGLAAGIQDRSIFKRQGEKTDELGNGVGFHGVYGYLEPELAGRVPFQFTPPSFLPESCVTRLRIQVAIADICKRNPPSLEPGKVNLWIPDNGSEIAEQGTAAGVHGIGAPATLTVSRDLSANPLPASCGAGFELVVTPSAAQLDRDLPIEKFWPLERYWPWRSR